MWDRGQGGMRLLRKGCEERTLNVTTITSSILEVPTLAQTEVPTGGRVRFLSPLSSILGLPQQDIEEKQHGFKPKAITK